MLVEGGETWTCCSGIAFIGGKLQTPRFHRNTFNPAITPETDRPTKTAAPMRNALDSQGKIRGGRRRQCPV
jgi:hypothetical protein